MKKVFAIIGSTRAQSSNLRLVQHLARLLEDRFEWVLFEGLAGLPHFNPDLDTETPPASVQVFRAQIAAADAVLVCTPEYVFSMPGSLKNALEWCVSTLLFTQKPVGLITAAASGEKGHEALQLIMRTIDARFNDETSLLIRGVKGKFDPAGNLVDPETIQRLAAFAEGFGRLCDSIA